MKNKLELLATLWPSFPHFKKFADDPRLSAIRLNSAMMKNPELEKEFGLLEPFQDKKPFFFDVKARQLRVTEVFSNPNNLELRLNHPIAVETPTVVLFKAGADKALLESVADDGYRLIFYGGPQYCVYPGESLHIRHSSLCVFGDAFTQEELQKIEKAKKAGFTRFFLSYVENQADIDLFLELVGKDSQIMLKIENKKGLAFVANDFKKKSNLTLVAARGDLYVEISRPHQIIEALKLIIQKDSESCVGSRLLLSIISEPVPSCADFLELAWLYDIGYRKMMLCDEICLKENLLATAINAFENFREIYA